MKNKMKRLLSLMLVLATTLSLLPIIPAQAADTYSDSLPSSASLYVGGVGSQWYSTQWGSSYYIQDLGLYTDTTYSSAYPAVCYSRGTAMSSSYEWYTYSKSYEADLTASLPFLDFFSSQVYEEGLNINVDTRTKYKSLANVVVWMEQEGTVDSSLLTECASFDYDSFSSSTSPQLYKVALEYYSISTNSGNAITVVEAAEFLASIVKLWNQGSYPYRTYYVYTCSSASIQSILVSEYEPKDSIPESYTAYVTLDKVDGTTNAALSGVTFTVYSNSSCTIAEGSDTTDSSGVATIAVSSTTGTDQTFYVKETSAPSGYTLDTTVYPVSVSFTTNTTEATAAEVNGGTTIKNYTTIIADDPNDEEETPEVTSDAKISKIDSKTLDGIGPATFEIYGTEYNSVQQDPLTFTDNLGAAVGPFYVTTDSSGVFQFQWTDSSAANYIAPGNYYVREYAAPDGYELDNSTIQELNLWLDVSTVISSTDTDYYEEGGVKSEEDFYTTTYTPRYSGDLLFTNDKLNDVTLKKVDADTGSALSGAIFDIYYNGTFIGSDTTNSSGEITLESVDSGYYVFEETSAPTGYILPQQTTYGIAVDATDTSTTEYVLTVENSAYPDIIVTKYREGTTQTLAGAVFEIWLDNISLGDDFVTDSNGQIVLSYSQYKHAMDSDSASWVVTAEELSPPDGYTANTATEDIIKTATLVREQDTVELNFYNEPYPGLIITKQATGTDEYLVGATYNVTVDNASMGSFTTDTDGQILIDFDTYGDFFPSGKEYWTVTVTETSAPAGYLLNSTPQTITVYNGQELAEFSFENEPYPMIYILKVDADTQEPLEYTYFDVSIDNQSMGTFRTNGDGEIWIDYEVYYSYLDETKTSWTVTVTETSPTSGYLQATTVTKTIEMNTGESMATFKFENYKAPEIYIYKYSASDDIALAGATFKVSIDGTSIGTFATDSNGEICINYDMFKDYLDIDESSWTVTAEEIAPPSGYFLDEDPTQTIELSATTSPAIFTFTNEAYPNIVIEKRDIDTYELLAGATYEVQIDDATVGTFTTDSTGKITISYEEYGRFLGAEDNDGWTVVVTEITPPANYFGTTYQSNQMYKGQALSPFVFENQEYPDVVVYKTDSETQLPLEGAVFTLTSSDSSFVTRTATTDEDGYITFEHVPEGVYTLQETTAPTNYFMDDTTQTVIVKVGCDSVLTYYFENDRMPTLEIIKLDAITKDPLQYAKFTITRQNDDDSVTTLGTYTTDENGSIALSELPEGWYTVTETEPPSGYLISDENTQTFYLEGNVSKTVTFENDPLNALVIEKVDSVTGEALQGAKFQVSYMSGTSGTGGTVIGTYTTSYNGTITITGLEAGTYIVEETQAPDGYVLDDTAQTVYLSGDEQSVVTLEFANRPNGGLAILKLDSSDNQPLAGAIFKVTTVDGVVVGSSNGYYTTDSSGVIQITDIEPGSYVVTETQAPDGYVLETTSQNITITDGAAHSLTFYNAPKGNLIIVKVDSDTNETLEGAVFEITHSDGSYAATAEGSISSNGRYTTDSNGQITVTLLEPDTYVVTEVIAPDGYVLNSTPQTVVVYTDDTQTLTFGNPKQGSLVINKIDSITGEALSGAVFKITNSEGTYIANDGGTISSNGLYTTDGNGQIIIYDLDPQTIIVTEVTAPDGYVLDTTSQTVRVNENDTQTLTFENTPIGGLTIIKTDEDDGDRIKGVEFEVRKKNGELVGYYTTNSNGTIYLSALANGWYTVQEIDAADGYILDDTIYDIEVKDGETATLKITNHKESNIIIRKVDSDTGDGLYGAVFILYDSNSNPIGEYTSDNRGYVYIDGVDDGKYKIREIEAPEGYMLDDEYKTIYVRYGSSSEVTWENTAIKGQIQITKYAADDNTVTGVAAGTPLAGAVYEISYERSGRVAGYITTDARGVAASQPLPLGRYIIKEVTAPAYYQLSTDVYDVTLEYEGQIIKLANYNTSATLDVSITKTGIAEVLAGSTMAYNFIIANTSNTQLEDFYWHDRIPTDVTTATSLTTGTYNQRLTYQILYKTNYQDYQVLASNLLTTNNYAFALNTIPLMSGEVVTDIYYEFGTVPAGFQSVTQPTLSVTVSPSTPTDYNIINRADVGGQYQNQWAIREASWITIVRNLTPVTPLPTTGY